MWLVVQTCGQRREERSERAGIAVARRAGGGRACGGLVDDRRQEDPQPPGLLQGPTHESVEQPRGLSHGRRRANRVEDALPEGHAEGKRERRGRRFRRTSPGGSAVQRGSVLGDRHVEQEGLLGLACERAQAHVSIWSSARFSLQFLKHGI